MKNVIFLFIVCSIVNLHLPAQEKASTILEKAFTKAKIENKNVMVIFHASCCGWCIRMDKNMYAPSCKELFERNM